MSYAHTKRRKTIKFLKKVSPKHWRKVLRGIGDETSRVQDGPLLGSLETLLRKD